MRHQELLDEIAEHCFIHNGTANCDQLRTLREDAASDGTKSTEDNYIPGLSKKMVKGELQQLCRDKKIAYLDTETCLELRNKLRGCNAADAACSGSQSVNAGTSRQIMHMDLMRFGQYKHWTYEQVLCKDWGYCWWCVLQYEKNKVAALLARFAR